MIHSEDQTGVFEKDFAGFIFGRIKNKENQTFLSKLRHLSKTYNNLIEKSIDSVRVKIQSLETFTKKCLLREQIQNLKIEFRINKQEYKNSLGPGSVPRIYRVDFNELRLLSTMYFSNLKQVNFLFNMKLSSGIGARQIGTQIEEDFSLHGVNITSNVDFVLDVNAQNHNVNISNVKFDGLGLRVMRANLVKVINTQFLNISACLYDWFYTQSVGSAFNVEQCQQVDVNKITVQNCKLVGISFERVPTNFSLGNIHIQNCGVGVQIHQSSGKIENLIVENCKIGVQVFEGSQVRYKHIQFVNSERQNIDVDERSSFVNS